MVAELAMVRKRRVRYRYLNNADDDCAGRGFSEARINVQPVPGLHIIDELGRWRMGEKTAVLKLLEQLPDEATLEEIQSYLYVLQKIRAGQEAVDRGQVILHEDVMRELAGWLS